MPDVEADSLSAADKAYIDSKGETPLAPEPPRSEGDAAPEPRESEGSEAAEPADGPSEETEGEGGPKPRSGKTVPIEALHETRAELRQQKEERARFEETVNQRLQMLMKGPPKQPDAPPPPPPDWEENPIEAGKGLQRGFESVEQRLARLEQGKHNEVAFSNFMAEYKQDADHAKATVPTFQTAYDFLSQTRYNQILAQRKMLGVDQSDQSIKQQIAMEEFNLVRGARAKGMRPAQAIYEMALATGFNPDSIKTSPASGEPQETKIARVAAAQEQNKTLGSAGGGPAGGPMTAARLGDMTEKEFGEYYAKNKPTVERLMGKPQ